MNNQTIKERAEEIQEFVDKWREGPGNNLDTAMFDYDKADTIEEVIEYILYGGEMPGI